MKSRFIYLLRYFLFWLFFFTASRIIFMAFHYDQSLTIPLSGWFNILIRGLWMDASLTGYFLLLSSLTMAIFFYSNTAPKIIPGIITPIMLIIFTVIVITDLELYRHWNFRIDATPLFYLLSPNEAFASIKTKQLVILIFAVLLVFAGFYVFFRNWVQKYRINKANWLSIPVFLIISAAAIIPIRGGFGIAAMNPGKVYFSKHVFWNHASLNVVWNFGYSIMKSGDMHKKYPEYISQETATRLFDSLAVEIAEAPFVLKTRRPNVVIILLEGFTSKVIEPLGGMKGVTPNLTKLAKEGLLFSDFYASGDRSNKGLVAVLSGFPAQPTFPVIKNTLAASKLPTISSVMMDAGYRPSFYYGGDPDFSNIRAYLVQAGFHEIISQDDFPRSYRNSKWGVHDEYVFERLLTDLDTAQGPYLKFLFTLSSHEPFDIPCKPAFPGSSEEDAFLSSICYTDDCLGRFFEKARTKDFYNNTLFVLIADHGHRHPNDTPYYMPEKFTIPMLWLGGALDQTSVIDKTGSQTDLARTLLFQLGLKTDRFLFSRNLLATSQASFAYYAFNDGFGFVNADGIFVWDHISRQAIIATSKISIEQAAFAYFHVYQKYFLGL